ncbi:MAG: T9SS type A sorting domain-containing protein, partial [Winogradskyella sp.]|nr:T9SS type A sorting domain-containing protein [Winogradskyella sp.]
FALRFDIPESENETLNVAEENVVNLNYYYSNARNKIIILNPHSYDINALEMYNILGQSVYQNQNPVTGNYQEYSVENLSTGTYIIKLYTDSGNFTKKVIIK